jgi:hypothetical protein
MIYSECLQCHKARKAQTSSTHNRSSCLSSEPEIVKVEEEEPVYAFFAGSPLSYGFHVAFNHFLRYSLVQDNDVETISNHEMDIEGPLTTPPWLSRSAVQRRSIRNVVVPSTRAEDEEGIDGT